MKKQTPEELKAIIQSAIDEANKLLHDNISKLQADVESLRNEFIRKNKFRIVYSPSIRAEIRLFMQ